MKQIKKYNWKISNTLKENGKERKIKLEDR